MTSGPRDMDHSPQNPELNPAAKIAGAKKIVVLRLLPRTEGQEEKVFKFDKERIVLGSVVSADLRLTGDGVSPIHAVLELSQDSQSREFKGVIFDLASDTGVFVNDKKVVAHTLNKNDQIVIGKHHIKFSLEELNRSSGKDRIRETEGRSLFLNPNEDLAPLNLEDERGVIEIFDYRPTSKRALEVVMSWFGTILTVEHFVREKNVTIGSTQKSDFVIPSILSSGHYKIVTQKQGEFILNLDSKMKGVMQRSGELQSLDQIRGQTLSGPQGFEVPIGNNDFAKISIGDIDFYFSYTAAPPRLKRRRIFERDPYFLKVLAFSLFSTVLAFIALSRVKISQNVEADKIPDRIATILYQPEKYMHPAPVPTPSAVVTPPPKPTPKETPQEEIPPPPKPKPTPKETVKIKLTPKPIETQKPVPKVMNLHPEPKKPLPPVAQPKPVSAQPPVKPKVATQGAAKEGEGARAKGIEGTRGEPDKKRTQLKVTEVNRPSPNGGAKGASGDSQVNTDGNVDILKGMGGRIQNILGNSAAHLHDGGESLKGFGNFSTGGSGGLALGGSGQGGGGDALTTLGGLGKKGFGMGRVGTGKGAAGNGSGIIGASARVSIRAQGPEESVVMGAIDRSAVESALAAHRDEFRLCYEREINAEHPTLSGRVATSFVIGASGHVTHAGLESSSLHNPNAERCVLTVLKRIEFPVPSGGGIVEVRKTFNFSTSGS